MPAFSLELLIAVLIIASALNSLRGKGPPGGEARTLAKRSLLLIGAVTGIASSMSGTGGPLVLIPILLWLHVPVLAAVGLSQVIQLPISAFATTGNILYGTIDVAVAAALSVLLMVGVWFGARIAHRVSNVAFEAARVADAARGWGVMMLVKVARYASAGGGGMRRWTPFDHGDAAAEAFVCRQSCALFDFSFVASAQTEAWTCSWIKVHSGESPRNAAQGTYGPRNRLAARRSSMHSRYFQARPQDVEQSAFLGGIHRLQQPESPGGGRGHGPDAFRDAYPGPGEIESPAVVVAKNERQLELVLRAPPPPGPEP